MDVKTEIERLKKEKQAVVLAHYYQKGDIQDIADYIGDSLALAQQAVKLKDAKIIVSESIKPLRRFKRLGYSSKAFF